MGVGQNMVLIKPEADISEVSGFAVEAKKHHAWSLYAELVDVGNVVYVKNGNMRSALGIRALQQSVRASCDYRNDDVPKPGCRVMYSYLDRIEAPDVDGNLLIPYNSLYAYFDGDWKTLNGWLLVQGDEIDAEERMGGFTIFHDDVNKYGFGTVKYAGRKNTSYLHGGWDDPAIVAGSKVIFNKNSAHRIEAINTTTDGVSSLFAIHRKDVGLL